MGGDFKYGFEVECWIFLVFTMILGDGDCTCLIEEVEFDALFFDGVDPFDRAGLFRWVVGLCGDDCFWGEEVDDVWVDRVF